jgi:hypothetical protein
LTIDGSIVVEKGEFTVFDFSIKSESGVIYLHRMSPLVQIGEESEALHETVRILLSADLQYSRASTTSSCSFQTRTTNKTAEPIA